MQTLYHINYILGFLHFNGEIVNVLNNECDCHSSFRPLSRVLLPSILQFELLKLLIWYLSSPSTCCLDIVLAEIAHASKVLLYWYLDVLILIPVIGSLHHSMSEDTVLCKKYCWWGGGAKVEC